MKQAFLVVIETLKSEISQEELEVILYDELCLTYYHPSVDVVEITKIDPESDEETKTDADEYFELKKHAEGW